jgi:hypothetical protein
VERVWSSEGRSQAEVDDHTSMQQRLGIACVVNNSAPLPSTLQFVQFYIAEFLLKSDAMVLEDSLHS